MSETKDTREQSILIVDDLPKNIQLVAKILTKEGYNLFFAQSGEAALKQLEDKTFDLILLDIMMPKMNGFEVCKRLKSNYKTQQIPVIFLTAKTDDESILKGFESGGIDYVTKPFIPSELIARVKTHIRLQQREKDLRELNKAKDTLFSIIGHDLKTPFFTIMGLADILRSNYDSYSEAERKELISYISESAKASHILLDNLLNWTRLQTGVIKSDPIKLDLQAMIHENLELLQSQAQTKEVALNYISGSETWVNADVNMLNTVIRNLINNAIKFTPKGGSVGVKISQTEGNALVSVSDTGVGISVKKLEKLISEEESVSTPGTENETGTGLGFILIKNFIKLNNGTIHVESKEGVGTTIYFSLPIFV